MANFNKGKIEKLWPYLVALHKTNPGAFEVDGTYLKTIVSQNWALLKQHEACPNCQASMQQYTPTVDYFDACLLRAMAEAVRSKVSKGVPFTEANKVHVQTEINADYTTKSRTTKCRQLGLVAKVIKDGKHDQQAGWVITVRGWQFLHNNPVPKTVTVFRNEIIDRSEEQVTIMQIFEKRKDYNYNPQDWIGYGGISEGQLL